MEVFSIYWNMEYMEVFSKPVWLLKDSSWHVIENKKAFKCSFVQDRCKKDTHILPLTNTHISLLAPDVNASIERTAGLLLNWSLHCRSDNGLHILAAGLLPIFPSHKPSCCSSLSFSHTHNQTAVKNAYFETAMLHYWCTCAASKFSSKGVFLHYYAALETW